MRNVMQWCIFIVSFIVFPVVAFYIASILVTISAYVTPYVFFGTHMDTVSTHIICCAIALVVSLSNYPRLNKK